MKKERITLDMALKKVESLILESRKFDKCVSDATEKNMETLRELITRIWQNAYNQGVLDTVLGDYEYHPEEEIIE